MKKTLYFLLSISLLSVPAAFAQVNSLTSQQIQQRAAAMGYNVDSNQVRQYEQNQQPGNASSFTPTLPTESARFGPVIAPPAAGQISKYFVPAFAKRTGADRLPAFGYSVFTYSPTTFQPTLNVPTPVNYIIGPGDEIIISLWGETQLVQDLTVSKNGDIYIPNVGLISVNGLDMKQLRDKLYDRLSKVYASLVQNKYGEAGTHLNVSTGQLRSVKIYVLGEVEKPGGYTLPALSSAFTALYYSGGPSLNGTLRNVEVLRNGKVVDHIDLYNYLIDGDQSQDIRLNDGDIVFVPPVGKRVAITGSVFRPAIYELKKGETLGDLLKYASGLTFNAYFQTVHIDRVIPFSQRSDFENNILSIDINFKSVEALDSSSFALDDGDVVKIDTINYMPQNMVSITGDVRQPGVYELQSGMTVRELISKADSLFPDAFMGKAILIRTLPSEKKEMLSFSLAAALKGDAVDNLTLANRDSIHIYRDTTFFPMRWVQIFGDVRNPGTYRRYANMSLSDLIIRAGGLNDSATTQDIEIARLDTMNSEIYASRVTVNLPTDYWDVPTDRAFMLRDYDRVLIRPDTSKTFENGIYVRGEVAFPGEYAILYRGEKLFDFVKRAGGFKRGAYPQGMYVLRHNPLISSLRPVQISDTTFMRVYDGQPLINRAEFNAQFGDRIPILWSHVENSRSSIYNLRLIPNDTLVVPANPHTVTVVGDVGLPSTVPYNEGAGLSYYIGQAGGYTSTSAEGREIVILPNGMKWNPSGWFFVPNPPILSGSTIYVPSYIKSTTDTWPIIRDIITVVSSTAVLVLTISRL